MYYEHKYIKYKMKYINAKEQTGGAKQEEYLTHDNGGRPFKVVIDKNINQVTVYKANWNIDRDNCRNCDDYVFYKDPILVVDPEEIFIGKSPKIAMTEFSLGYGPKFDGNSILLHMKADKYIFIGSNIFSFESLAKIIKFVSPVGGSDVPYPYAIDENNNYYLLTEDVILGAKSYDEYMKEYDEPYEYYYDYRLITMDRGYVNPKKPKNKFRDIDEWYIGNNRYTFRYKPFPNEEYDRLTTSKKTYNMTSDGKKIDSDSLFFLLIRAFNNGKHKNFMKIKDIMFPVTINKNMTITNGDNKKGKLSKELYEEFVQMYQEDNSNIREKKISLPITITDQETTETTHYDMFVADSTGKKTKLTKEMYIELMNDFGKERSFIPLNKEIIQKRLT